MCVYFEDTGSNTVSLRLHVVQVRGDRLLGVIAWNSRTKSYAFHCDRRTILIPQAMKMILEKIESLGSDDPTEVGA